MDHAISNSHPLMTDIAAELRNVDLRATPSRVAILTLLQRVPDQHMTAEQVYRAVMDEPGCSLPSVYRTLSQLCEAKLVLNTTISEARVVYELNSKGAHHHLSCVGCGQLKDIVEPLLGERCAAVSAQFGFSYVGANLVIFGHCDACSKRHRQG
jgi:Fur family transcriptional regulator, ferric uptake regulator